jgi:preprotein translocase subunit SecA
MTGLMERLGLEEDVPIESPMVTRSIEGAQKKVEGRNFDQRKNVLEYDDVMNQQRKTIYALRRQILEGRYHREPTEDETKQGIVPEPVTSSGDWTQESLRPDVEPKLTEMIAVVKGKVRERDLRNAIEAGSVLDDAERKWLDEWGADKNNDGRPIPLTDNREGWRVLRGEVWRQFGALLDLEKRFDKEDLFDYCLEAISASLIQQRERLYDLADERMGKLIDEVLSPEVAEDDWDWDQLEDAIEEQYNITVEISPGTPDEAGTQVWPKIEAKLGEREKELSRPWLMYFCRHFSLEEIDQQWIEHLKTMDALREGIGLQGYGQKDPKKEYKKAGFSLFTEMMGRIQQNVVTKVFRVRIQREEEQIPQLQQKERQMVERGVADKSDDEAAAEPAQQKKGKRPQKARTQGEGAKTEPIKRDKPKVGRNDPCPCGSGKKYKKCHGKDEEAAASD